MAISKAKRHYNRAVLLSSLAYVVALFGGEWYLGTHPGAHHAMAYAAAIAPAIPIICIFVAIGRYLVDERDEYQRMLLVRQSLIASAFALSIATVCGFLESADLAPHLDSYWVAVVWFGGLGVGDCVNKLVERRAA
jgi:hypothetical protein